MPSKGRTDRSASRRGYGFKRETDLTRRKEIRDELRTILVVTNGERTEFDYFTAVKAEPWVDAGKVIVKFEAGAPAAIVARTASIRDDNDFDEAWTVCDLDEFDVTTAISDAASKQVYLVLSVPSFEVWLILHISDSCPGFNTAAQAERFLRSLLPGWVKTALNFADFRNGIDKAVARAKKLDEPPNANPSTVVWRLIESLKGITVERSLTTGSRPAEGRSE